MIRSVFAASILVAQLLGSGCATAPTATATNPPAAAASATSAAAAVPPAAAAAATEPSSHPAAAPSATPASASSSAETQAAPAAPAAPEAQPAPATPNDYAQPNNWLCVPGHNAACETPLDTTVIAANGKLTVEKLSPAKAPPIDCFYVYPTVSREPGMIASMTAAPEELGVVAAQFARFSQVCRPFAPLYRQFTLAALVARRSGRPMPASVDPKIGYRDIVDAWNYYLAHHNNGRGVVLIGHSQGSTVLTQLIKDEIEGKPVQSKLVSAILMGTRVQVAVGKDVGGDFRSLPLCHASHQIGCVVTYASFRATAPPTASSLFGKSAGPGLEAACVNPAALAGGSGPAHAYFGTRSAIVEASSQVDWVKGKTIDTPFVSVPGMLTAECKKNESGTYLAITVHGAPDSPRTSDIPGDVVVGGNVLPDWGLHLIDASLFMGNLLAIVRDQTTAYRRAKH